MTYIIKDLKSITEDKEDTEAIAKAIKEYPEDFTEELENRRNNNY